MKKFSFNRLLHNQKIVVALSVIIALPLWIWVTTLSGESTRQIVLPVPLTLTNSVAVSNDLRVLTQSTDTTVITVRGQRWQIATLQASDFIVRVNTSSLLEPNS
ncbi:MAG: hypothetical protein FWF49_02855, partial [Oscillospiraceae bacterium]|nr:hypothetical protein [Oscillospiraceae bacterium]